MANLTQAEHDLLKAHHSCFHCRSFYAGHFMSDCPLGNKGQPTAEACRNVTLSKALKAQIAFNATKPTVVAGIFETEDEDSFEMSEGKASEYVPNFFSFPPHLWWNCCIDAPFTCVPTPIHALIDHGSPPVLI